MPRHRRRTGARRYESNGALEVIGAGVKNTIDAASKAWNYSSDLIGPTATAGLGLATTAALTTDSGATAAGLAWDATKLGGRIGAFVGKGAFNELTSDNKWGQGVFMGYDFLAYWKMRFLDKVLSLVDRNEQTNPYVLWFIDMALQYLGAGDYMTFMSIFAGLVALRNAHRLVTLNDLYSLLPESPEQKQQRIAALEGYTGTAYNGNCVIRKRRRRRYA